MAELFKFGPARQRRKIEQAELFKFGPPRQRREIERAEVEKFGHKGRDAFLVVEDLTPR